MATSASAPNLPADGVVVAMLGDVLHSYLRRVSETVQVEPGAPVRADLATIRREASRRAIFYYQIEDVLPLLLYSYWTPDFLGPDFSVLCDETIAGRLVARMISRLDGHWLPLHWSDPATRIQDLKEIIRVQESIAMAVDGHGPYGQVAPAFVRLAKRCQAVAVPVAARTSRAWTVRLRARIHIPRSHSRLAIRFGQAIPCDGPPEDTQVRLQAALEETGRDADRALRSSPPI